MVVQKTKIPEDVFKREMTTSATALMTDEQRLRGQYYAEKYRVRKGELASLIEEFDSIMKLYSCKRDPVVNDRSFPCNVIPLITPIVEGQTAMMMESEIDYNYYSNNPLHRRYLDKIEAAGAYCRSLNNAPRHYKDFTRKYEIVGNSWIAIMLEKSFSTAKNRPSVYPRITLPSIGEVLVDGKIKDPKDLQFADYIIHEIGQKSIGWARKEYGDEYAEAVSLEYPINSNKNITRDDTDTFVLLHVWTRTNEYGNLQLIEMDSSGFILRESNPQKPFYNMVGNQYPFYMARMMPHENEFYGFGDGQMLKYIQIYQNRLADEIEVAARHNAQAKTYIDPDSEINVEDVDSDPSHPILVKDPRNNILVVQGQGINPVIMEAMQFNIQQAQRMSRFSDIMTGYQQGVSATATQISGQLSQGSVGIKDKASDIQDAMAWCDRYCLQLCLEKWEIPFWITKFRDVADDEQESSIWLDMPSLAKMPAVTPAFGEEAEKRRKAKQSEPGMDIVDYETVVDENTGEAVLIDLDFDVRVKLAAGFPRGKNDQFNQIVSLMQLNVMDRDGQVKPFMEATVAREKMEQILGFKLKSESIMSEADQLLNANQINPLGNSGEVVQPQGSRVRTQPSNLMGTVPLAQDSRRLQL